MRFGCGWSKFMQANQLQLGQICKFELIDEEEKLIQVILAM